MAIIVLQLYFGGGTSPVFIKTILFTARSHIVNLRLEGLTWISTWIRFQYLLPGSYHRRDLTVLRLMRSNVVKVFPLIQFSLSDRKINLVARYAFNVNSLVVALVWKFR